MAKKVIHNHNKEEVATCDIPPAPAPDHSGGDTTSLSDQTTPVPPKPERVIPEHADRILKAFPNYPELFIDFQGGTFTVDTPACFRSNATLYKNPYHKL